MSRMLVNCNAQFCSKPSWPKFSGTDENLYELLKARVAGYHLGPDLLREMTNYAPLSDQSLDALIRRGTHTIENCRARTEISADLSPAAASGFRDVRRRKWNRMVSERWIQIIGHGVSLQDKPVREDGSRIDQFLALRRPVWFSSVSGRKMYFLPCDFFSF